MEMIRARPAVPVPLEGAQGLVLADDLVAGLALPVFDNSAMDGYAVRAEDTTGATPEHPVVLPVAEDIPAGRTDELTLQPGTAHRIMTGAPVPAGTTAVVPVEDTDGCVQSDGVVCSPRLQGWTCQGDNLPRAEQLGANKSRADDYLHRLKHRSLNPASGGPFCQEAIFSSTLPHSRSWVSPVRAGKSQPVVRVGPARLAAVQVRVGPAGWAVPGPACRPDAMASSPPRG